VSFDATTLSPPTYDLRSNTTGVLTITTITNEVPSNESTVERGVSRPTSGVFLDNATPLLVMDAVMNAQDQDRTTIIVTTVALLVFVALVVLNVVLLLTCKKK